MKTRYSLFDKVAFWLFAVVVLVGICSYRWIYAHWQFTFEACGMVLGALAAVLTFIGSRSGRLALSILFFFIACALGFAVFWFVDALVFDSFKTGDYLLMGLVAIVVLVVIISLHHDKKKAGASQQPPNPKN